MSAPASDFINGDVHSVNDGVADNYIQCLLEDDKGFLWVGTWSGLNRYDGADYKSYFKSTNNKNSLPGNWIYCLLQNKNKTIWVGTDEGIAYYNSEQDIFQTVPGIPSTSFVSICDDSQGNLFAVAGNTLYKIDGKSKQVAYAKKIGVDANKKAYELSVVECDAHGNIWLGIASYGLAKFNAESNQLKFIENKITTDGLIKDHIHCVEIDVDGTLWLGTYNDGLYHYDIKNETLTERFVFNPNEPKSIANNRVESFFIDKSSNLWVVTANASINKFNRKEKQFDRRSIKKEDDVSHEIISSTCFLIDRFENTWIGTHGNGLLSYNKQKENFKNTAISTHISNGNKISSLLPLNNGTVLVGTDGAGLSLYNCITHSYSPIDLGSSFNNAKILSIKQGAGNEIWMAFWNSGVACIDATTYKITKHFPGNDTNGLSNPDIKGLWISDSLLWIASNGGGVFLYNTKTKKWINTNSLNVPFDLSNPKWCNSIYVDSKKRVWISTSKGLFLNQGKTLMHFENKNNDAKSLISKQVSCVYEDKKNRIWVITNGGLDLYNESDKSFIHYSELYHLPKLLKGIAEDKKGKIWISSNEGITSFDVEKKQANQFTMADGLPSNSFYQNTAASTIDGSLLFGSLNGFTFFHPDSIHLLKNIPDVVLTDFQLNYISQTANDSKAFHKHIQSLDSITLPYSNNVLTFKFIAVDLCNSKNLRYSYYLQNYNNDWVDLGKQNTISFTNLSPGSYELKIRAQNLNGSISKNSTTLHIIILPPWYKTTWAYIIYTILSTALLYFIYYFLTLTIRSRNKLALQRLQHQKKLEIYNAKIEFFTSISHDIRTPLTLILSPLDLIRDKIQNNEEALEMLDTVDKNAHNLLDLTNELLEFKNLESGERTVKLSNTDAQQLVENVVARFKNEAILKKIKLSTSLCACSATLDPHLIDKALNNLLINAFKFTNNSGSISISMTLQNNNIIFTVFNSGSFISDSLKNKIFDPFYSSKNDKGFGLGLAIVKEITLLHKGKIEVNNNTDGVEFSMIIPKN
ncbi:MAG: triple tyrosine motif-containing protein [Bacteroidetes bacterium]|nr:triple tyrosine motif-containing protein [Bacteroidota bacterium]